VNFIELLAPERRAGIFQTTAADTETNARVLKGLLALHSALGPGEGRAVDTTQLSGALSDFLSGADEMLAYRQLYAAGRLLARKAELKTVMELADSAKAGVDAAVEAPAATVAVMADDLRDARAQAINSGGVLSLKEVERKMLSNILRGRIEDLTGWALFNQDQVPEALKHLRLALSILPEGTVWWRATLWHLGASLEASGSQQEALAAYLRAYNPFAPSPVQRAIIETLYRKVNGSLDGLDAKIGPK
jgi:tetratricopeptide (TPR) repeat protein